MIDFIRKTAVNLIEGNFIRVYVIGGVHVFCFYYEL